MSRRASAGLRLVPGLLQEGGWYLLLILLPFSKAAVEITFVLLLVGWLLARLDPVTRAKTVWRTPAFRPLLFALTGYLAACALSILMSDNPGKSLHGFLGKWTEYALFCVVVADVSAQPRVRTTSLILLTVSAVTVVIEAATQQLFGHGVFRHFAIGTYERVTGPYENPIDLATYLMVLLPIVATMALAQRGIIRIVLWSVSAVVVAYLAETEAVGAWLGLIIGCGAMGVVSRRLRWLGLGLLMVVVLAAGVHLHRVGRLRASLSFSDIGTTDRWAMWGAALGMIRDRPVLGHGVNTFMENYLTYWVGGERQPRYAHNCYLQVAAETGIVGLLLFLNLLYQLFRGIVRAARGIQPDQRLVLTGVLAGLVAFAAQAGVDTNFYALRQAALFWTLAGFGLGAGAWLAHPVATGGDRQRPSDEIRRPSSTSA